MELTLLPASSNIDNSILPNNNFDNDNYIIYDEKHYMLITKQTDEGGSRLDKSPQTHL